MSASGWVSGSNSREKGSSGQGGIKKKESSVVSKNTDRMKDDYVKFIMREQVRREKEFKNKVNDKDNIYSQVAQI